MPADAFSLKDHLFNPDSISDLSGEYAAALPGFDRGAFEGAVLAGFPERELLARLDWIADCLEPYLPRDFPAMAQSLEAAMPPPLDPALRDNDFGRFIHAVPGILAVRHGLDSDPDRALDLLYRATQRFSMEFYIRPFLNHHPERTLARLALWAKDGHYHVRRLVSEGTRPKLPWAKAVRLTPDQTLPLLDALHADPTRYVTRSVANHLNDLSKTVPHRVLATLGVWSDRQQQDAQELSWMTRHALRTQIKAGDPEALRLIGYDPDAAVDVYLTLPQSRIPFGTPVSFEVHLSGAQPCRVLVDYVMAFPTPSGKTRQKTFKLKQTQVQPDAPTVLSKTHTLKAKATTYTLCPGRHEIAIQVNGRIRTRADFDVTE